MLTYGSDKAKISPEEHATPDTVTNFSIPELVSTTEKTERRVSQVEEVVKKIENSKAFRFLDAYKVEPRPPTFVGGLISLLILPVTVAYIVIVLISSLSAPKLSNNNIIWSIYGGPFPMTIRCEAASGCLVSNDNDNTKIGPCLNLSFGSNATLSVEYFQNPLLGVSAIARLEDSTAPAISILSQTYMPRSPAADSDGTMLLWSGALPGTTLVSMVTTTNYTLHGSGRTRREWFGVLVDYAASPIAGSTPCSALAAGNPAAAAAASAGAAGAAGWRQARVRMQPSYNDVTVTDPSSPEQVAVADVTLTIPDVVTAT